jgi:hypothetical protein
MRSITSTFFAIFLLVASVTGFAQSNPVPLIYQPLNPVHISPGHAAFPLAVHGTGFVRGAVVRWNDRTLTTKFRSRSLVVALVPSQAVAKASTASVTVVNPGGIASNVLYLPIRQPASTVTVIADPNVVEGGEVVLGDFNNDHEADIAVAWNDQGAENATADLYLTAGRGRFTKISGPQKFGPILLDTNAVGDVNNDGNLDATVCTSSGGPDQWCGIYLGDGRGGLTSTIFGVPAIGALADVNGDGVLDYVTVSSDCCGYYFSVYLGSGDGSFSLVVASFVQLNSLGVPFWGLTVIADFNGDGKLDAAVPGMGQLVPGPGPVAVFLGNGDGTFDGEVDYQLPWGGGFAAVADVNGDGRLDIVNNGSAVLLGNGDGTFTAGSSFNFNFEAANVQIADLNADGKLDLATATVSNDGSQTLNVLLGNGDGTFQDPITLAASIGRGDIGIADFNNDGLLDFVVGGSPDRSSTSTVLLQRAPK